MSLSFETDRLLLEPFQLGDEQQLHELFTDEFIRKFLWDDIQIEPIVTQEVIEQNNDLFRNENWGLWKIISLDSQSLMGFVGLWKFFNETRPQLLYGLKQKFTGNGFAVEAAGKIMSYAIKELNFPYLDAACDVPNEPSQRVAKALGMQVLKEVVIDNKPTIFFRFTA